MLTFFAKVILVSGDVVAQLLSTNIQVQCQEKSTRRRELGGFRGVLPVGSS
jgi:hypothetical protein